MKTYEEERKEIQKKINIRRKKGKINFTNREKFIIADSYFVSVDEKDTKECDRLARFIESCNYDDTLVRANSFASGIGGDGSILAHYD